MIEALIEVLALIGGAIVLVWVLWDLTDISPKSPETSVTAFWTASTST